MKSGDREPPLYAVIYEHFTDAVYAANLVANYGRCFNGCIPRVKPANYIKILTRTEATYHTVRWKDEIGKMSSLSHSLNRQTSCWVRFVFVTKKKAAIHTDNIDVLKKVEEELVARNMHSY